MIKHFTRFVYLVVLGTAVISSSHAASIIAYVEAPTVEATTVPGAITSNFEGLPAGIFTTPLSTLIGTYNSGGGPGYAIVNADSYGGAGDTGQYLAVGVQSQSPGPVLLTLKAPSNYFGFWWSAGDNSNSLTFYSGGQLVATFTTNQIVALIPNDPNTTVTAINGSVYHTNQYYNNPNGGDASEPFAYVDFIATGLTFDQVGFSNPSLGSGFESDNHSVAANVTGPPITDVIVENVPLAAPEPASYAMIGGGLCALAFIRRRGSR